MLGFVYLLLIAHAKASYDIRNKSFVFISGHPQSGTSLLMQLLDVRSRFTSISLQSSFLNHGF